MPELASDEQPEPDPTGEQLDIDAGGRVVPPAPAEYDGPEEEEDEQAPHGRGPDGAPLAPYGLRADGVPRRRPGRRAGTSTTSTTSARRKRRTRKRAAAAAPRASKPAAAKSSANAKPGAQYVEGFGELFDLLAGALDIAARATMASNPQLAATLTADSMTVKLGSERLVPVLAEVADHVPALGALVSGIAATGPYGKLLVALVPLGAQLAVNHGALTPGMLGTQPPEQLLIASGRYQPAPPAQTPPGYAAA